VVRVAVAYRRAALGGRDWYQLGATVILRYQDSETGLWAGRYAQEVDTSFALLFLRKSNLTRDLTANLLTKGRGSQSTLRSNDAKDLPPPTPPNTTAPEAQRLAQELKTARPERQTAILDQLRDRPGSEYTDALAQVIPQLTGDVQRQARDALAQRMARMTAETIRARLRDENAELRRAAALACAMKEDKSFISDLIGILDDADPWVVRASAVALRTLTGQDFGPSANATSDERKKAIAAWRDWWKRQAGR
jgi:HEAT repeat protein